MDISFCMVKLLKRVICVLLMQLFVNGRGFKTDELNGFYFFEQSQFGSVSLLPLAGMFLFFP